MACTYMKGKRKYAQAHLRLLQDAMKPKHTELGERPENALYTGHMEQCAVYT